MRIYIPATTTILRSVLRDDGLPAVPFTAFAVTPELRDWYVDDDMDELEYAASSLAARASIRLVDIDPGAARRRVVISADVDESAAVVQDQAERGAVRVERAIDRSQIAAIHVDDADATEAVAAAAAVVVEADLGLESAQQTVDDADGFELSWYAPQELEHLVEDLLAGD